MGAQHSLRGAVMKPIVASAVFDPSPYGTVLAYFNAAAITGKVDGGQISQWDDLSGNARHLTQATSGLQPLYKTSIFGSDPAVRFAGSGDYLAYLAGADWHSLTTLTYVMRRIRRGHTDFDGALALTAGGASFDYSAPTGAIIGDEPDSTHIEVTRNGVSLGSSTAAAIGTPFVETGKWDGTNFTRYVDGSAVGSAAASGGSWGIRNMVVAARFLSGIPDAPYAQQDFKAIVLFADALNDSNRNAVEAGI